MKTTVEFIDAVKARHGLTSDYQLAKHLKIRPNRISNYRLGKSLFDEEACLMIAADLGLDPGYVFACIAAERANKPEVKAAWKHTADLLYGIAAAVMIIAIIPSVTLPASDGLNAAFSRVSSGSLYIMSNLIAFYLVALASLATLGQRDHSPLAP